MKKIIGLLLLLSMVYSCENFDVTYDDFDYQTVYFPFQYPVRTLSLGNDIIDNSLDKEFKFNIGVNVGGLYAENKKDWSVSFRRESSLVEQYLINKNGDTLRVLPESYYFMNPDADVTIPKGSFIGLIGVQLTPSFFNDPRALTGEYVIPLIITTTSADSILQGKPAAGIVNPNRHILTDWDGGVLHPKDYTLFAVKYVNPYHGRWLRRSLTIVSDSDTGEVIDSLINRTVDIEKNQLVDFLTTSLTQVKSNYLGESSLSNFIMDIDEATKNILITSSEGSDHSVSGSGKFIDQSEEKESWGGKPRDAFYLNYSYSLSNGNTYQVYDTLVFRSRQISMETERPTLSVN